MTEKVIMAELIGRLMLTLVDAKTQAKTYTKVDAKTEAKEEEKTHAVADLPTRQVIVAKTELSLHVWSLKRPSATH